MFGSSLNLPFENWIWIPTVIQGPCVPSV
jgi:hypothetical protein